jgi:hypothetical protein
MQDLSSAEGSGSYEIADCTTWNGNARRKILRSLTFRAIRNRISHAHRQGLASCLKLPEPECVLPNGSSIVRLETILCSSGMSPLPGLTPVAKWTAKGTWTTISAHLLRRTAAPHGAFRQRHRLPVIPTALSPRAGSAPDADTSCQKLAIWHIVAGCDLSRRPPFSNGGQTLRAKRVFMSGCS